MRVWKRADGIRLHEHENKLFHVQQALGRAKGRARGSVRKDTQSCFLKKKKGDKLEEKKHGRMPELDEYVFATVKKIFPYGAFCALDEYDNVEAFIHVSEVAPRWIKNIHEFLKDGQRIVAKVYRFVPEKNLIDLSIKRVNETEKKRKIEGMQRSKRAEKLLELSAKRLGAGKEETAKVSLELSSNFEDVLVGLEEIAFNSKEAFKKLGLSKQWQDALFEVASQNIKKQRIAVSGMLKITCSEPNGVDLIKEALHAAGEIGAGKKGVQVKLSYLGAPNYKVDVEADDYKAAESILEAVSKKVEEKLKKHSTVIFSKAG